MRYLAKNPSGFYSFRIRIPNVYRDYFNQTEIVKALKTKSYNEARKLCRLVTADTMKLLQTLKLGVFDEAQEKLLVNQYLSKVLAKGGHTTGENAEIKAVETIVKPQVVEVKEEVIEKSKEEKRKTLGQIIEIYRKNIPNTTSDEQKRAYKTFFNGILLELIDKDTFMEDIDRERLLEVREVIQKLPKRNIQKYRQMKMSKILTLTNIKNSDKISMKTINDYLAWTTSLFLFSQKYGYIRFNPAINLKFKVRGNAKEQREIFTDEELMKFETHNTEDDLMKLFHYTLFYSGMINSEFLQAKINEVDGVLCFDLTDPNLKLKTLSRHRLIPIHTHLLKLGIVDKIAQIKKSYTPDYLSRISNKFINEHISTSSKKVLYSFRHTFATKLQNNMVEEAIIAQLMGHSKKGMTFSRYAKGYVANTLKDVIQTLEFPS